MLVHAVGKSIPPHKMPDRFRTDVAYFMTPSGDHGVPPLPPGEYWVRLEDARRWLYDLVVPVVSPLDAQSVSELELTDEQEAWLEWMIANEIEHVRVG